MMTVQPVTTFWTDERTHALARMWNAGATFREIAVALRTTTGAIKGKTDRLELKRGEHGRIEALKAFHARRRMAKARIVVSSTTALSRSVQLVCEPIYTPGPMAKPLHLNDGCAFPVGQATGADQLFCGEPVARRERYCAVCAVRRRGA